MNVRFVNRLILAAALSLPVVTFAQAPATAPAPKADKKMKAVKPAATPAPSDAEIAAAKAKGMVWVNLSSGVYHKDGSFYGKTKSGKFMTESDAIAAKYRAAKESAAKKKAAPAK